MDYLKMLVGIPAIAVDRHIRTFVARAGFVSNNYTEIRRIVEQAADKLEIHHSNLDYAIWAHVSQLRRDSFPTFNTVRCSSANS